MNWVCRLYLVTCSISLLEAQGTNDGCITCAAADDLFKAGWENLVVPAENTLQFLVPGSAPVPDTTIPKPDPKDEGINNVPGIVDQPDIELQTTVEQGEECDPNGAGVSVILAALTDPLCSQL